jgi:hypothetical protein
MTYICFGGVSLVAFFCLIIKYSHLREKINQKTTHVLRQKWATECTATLFFCWSYICRAMIIDLDAHQGNGHEKDFANDGINIWKYLTSIVCFYYLLCCFFFLTWKPDIFVMSLYYRPGLHFGYVQFWNISLCKHSQPVLIYSSN